MRYLAPADVPEAVDLVMVKPQFDVGRERVGKGEVVRDDVRVRPDDNPLPHGVVASEP